MKRFYLSAAFVLFFSGMAWAQESQEELPKHKGKFLISKQFFQCEEKNDGHSSEAILKNFLLDCGESIEDMGRKLKGSEVLAKSSKAELNFSGLASGVSSRGIKKSLYEYRRYLKGNELVPTYLVDGEIRLDGRTIRGKAVCILECSVSYESLASNIVFRSRQPEKTESEELGDKYECIKLYEDLKASPNTLFVKLHNEEGGQCTVQNLEVVDIGKVVN